MRPRASRVKFLCVVRGGEPSVIEAADKIVRILSYKSEWNRGYAAPEAHLCVFGIFLF